MMARALRQGMGAWLMCVGGSLVALGCGGGSCPTSRTPEDRARWEAELRGRSLLALDAKATLTIKRDVHDVLVDVDAPRFAAAFHDVMRDPERRYGLIRVDRLAENVGQPFTLGEKFQGRYSVEDAVQQQLRGKLRDWFGDLADDRQVQDWLCEVENEHTSDFGMISLLEMAPAPGKDYVLQYRYLKGSPIAGSSTFSVSEVTDPEILARHGRTHVTRLRQVFEYQEQSSSFATFFTKGGLRLHNQVVYSQAEQAAAAAGAQVLETDIPVEYRSF